MDKIGLSRIRSDVPRVGEQVRETARKEIDVALGGIYSRMKMLNFDSEAIKKNPALEKQTNKYAELRNKSLQDYSNAVELFIKDQVSPEEYEAIRTEVMRSERIESKITNLLPTTEPEVKEEILKAQDKIRQKAAGISETPAQPQDTNKLPFKPGR